MARGKLSKGTYQQIEYRSIAIPAGYTMNAFVYKLTNVKKGDSISFSGSYGGYSLGTLFY